MKKSALALILAVLMAVGLLTIGAAADDPVASIGDEKYDTLAQAVEKANDGDTIVVLKDCTLSTVISINKSITIDLAGHSITANTAGCFVVTADDKTFTIEDSSVDKNGSISAEYSRSNLIEVPAGELVVKGGNLSNNWYVIYVYKSGKVTIKDGTLTSRVACAVSTNGSAAGSDNYSADAVIDIQGGKLVSVSDVGIYLPAGTLYISGGDIEGDTAVYSKSGTTIITGGTIRGTGSKTDFKHYDSGCSATGDALVIEACDYPNGNPVVEISGGEFTSENADAVASYEHNNNEAEKIAVVGGKFSTSVSKFVPEGMIQGKDGKVVIDEEKAVASIGNVGYTSLESAIDAAKNGDTITLRKELNSENKTYTITKDITITGAKMTVERTVAGVAFVIRNNADLTFQGIELEINGDPDSCGKEGDAVTKGIDVYDGELYIIDSEVDFNNLRSAIVMQTAESRANIVSSLVSASNVWGNFSNGGYWHIIGSSLNISGNKDSKGHGLSATELEIWDSSVNINFCGLLGLTAKRLDVDNSTITVNECGEKLPYTSEWSTDKESYKYPVEIKNGGSVTIDEDSTITLMNNPAGNVLYLVNSTLKADGTLNASIRTNSGSEFYIVSIEGFNPMVVASGDTVKLPTVSKPGYIFMGWKCSDEHTHQAGETVTITGNMTFTAIWANMPDITPGTPGTPDDDDEPVVTFPFTDVREGQWFYEAVKYVYDEGIMNGMDRYTFDPNGSLTRAMVWTMLARHEGVDTEGGATWYAKAQEWAVEAGVSDGTDPMGNITREQLVTMLWRLNGSETTTGSLTGYTDYDKVSDWAGNAMLWATVNGIIEGDEANALNPTAGCTRAQAAAMIMRFCAYHEADSFGTVV